MVGAARYLNGPIALRSHNVYKYHQPNKEQILPNTLGRP